MAVDKKITRGHKKDDEGNIWAYTQEEFVNGDNQDTVRTYWNKYTKDDIPRLEEEIAENRENYHKQLAHIRNLEEFPEREDYKDFVKSIEEGRNKEFIEVYAELKNINQQIREGKIESFEDLIEKEKSKCEKALEEYKDIDKQIEDLKKEFENAES